MSHTEENHLESEESEELFDKPRGERRWLGKQHHGGKQRLFDSVKDRKFIEKTVTSQEPMSKKATSRVNDSTKDGLELNVVYSLDKKNRWRDADTITLLAAAPESVNAEVVQKNALEQYGCLHHTKSTLSVTSKVVSPDDAPGEFGIRSATSSGQGQDYSNFLPNSREFSKKANAKMREGDLQEAEEEKTQSSKPTVSYSIYKTHRSVDVVGAKMFKAAVVSKSGKHRANQKIDMEVYDDYEEDEEDEEEEEDYVEEERFDKVMNLSDYVLEPREKQNRPKPRKDSELSYEFVDYETLEPEPGYTDLMDIRSILRDEGYTFESADVVFHNQKDNMHHQFGQLQHDMKVVDLRPEQYLVDVSEQCQLDGASKDMETTTVIIFTHLKKNMYNVIVNSTIPNHPSKRGENYLKSQIASSMTIREAISRITKELMISRLIVDTMKRSAAFYGQKTLAEMVNDSAEWENQCVNMSWPNKNYHASWANSRELSTPGSLLEWADVCEMLKTPSNKTSMPFAGDACGVCSKTKLNHELFVTGNGVKCTECLRDEFYNELRAKRVPIDLKTESADELAYLPTFLPLTIINMYVRMAAEKVYKDAGAMGSFEKCNGCQAVLYFEVEASSDQKTTFQNQNRCCLHCGYSWCRHCDRVPHWPMECGNYAEWEEKWLLRYAMLHAQGTGTETLLQVTCSCKQQIYNCLLPESFVTCPNQKCNVTVNMHTMSTVYCHLYYPYQPRFRKLVEQGYFKIDHMNYRSAYVPQATVYTKIVKIPGIRASVMEVCGAARDARLDETTHNRATQREHALLRKGGLDGSESVENAMGTIAYLTELVTAWMHVSNQYDRTVKNTLETLMEQRKTLVERLEAEDSDGVEEVLRRIRKGLDSVVQAVEKRMQMRMMDH